VFTEFEAAAEAAAAEAAAVCMHIIEDEF